MRAQGTCVGAYRVSGCRSAATSVSSGPECGLPKHPLPLGPRKPDQAPLTYPGPDSSALTWGPRGPRQTGGGRTAAPLPQRRGCHALARPGVPNGFAVEDKAFCARPGPGPAAVLPCGPKGAAGRALGSLQLRSGPAQGRLQDADAARPAPSPTPRLGRLRCAPLPGQRVNHCTSDRRWRHSVNPASRSGDPRTHWHPRRLSIRSCRGPELALRPCASRALVALARNNSLRRSFLRPHPAMRRLALPRAAPAVRARCASRAGSWSQSACVACGVPRKARRASRGPRGAGGGSAGLHGGAGLQGWARSELLGTTLPSPGQRPAGMLGGPQVGGFHMMKRGLEMDADQ